MDDRTIGSHNGRGNRSRVVVLRRRRWRRVPRKEIHFVSLCFPGVKSTVLTGNRVCLLVCLLVVLFVGLLVGFVLFFRDQSFPYDFALSRSLSSLGSQKKTNQKKCAPNLHVW